MRLGIFGGTFNPVHYGHLLNAEMVRAEFSLDRVLFIPAPFPVHKELDGAIGAGDRLAMVDLAIRGNDGFAVSDIETRAGGPAYTIDTVTRLEQEYPGEGLFLVIGSDSYDELAGWRSWEALVSKVSIIVLKRREPFTVNAAVQARAREVLVAENPVIGISSTAIRDRVRGGKSIRYMTPDPVIEYITERRLYSG